MGNLLCGERNKSNPIRYWERYVVPQHKLEDATAIDYIQLNSDGSCFNVPVTNLGGGDLGLFLLAFGPLGL